MPKSPKASGILNWMVEGRLRWEEIGLALPGSMWEDIPSITATNRMWSAGSLTKSASFARICPSQLSGIPNRFALTHKP